jgi:REP element-mobilizing transposase RayT
MSIPKRNTGPNALRRGRFSVPNANYFVTCNLEPRVPVLVPRAANDIVASAHQLHREAIWCLRCMTVMPDHVHLFFTLHARLSLSQSIARLKHDTSSCLISHRTDWQDNFYDHRLRPTDSAEATIRYIWLNPYRAGLISAQEVWPHFYCCAEDWAWFGGLTDKGLPDPAWLC